MLTRETLEVWNAMGIGPAWILRDAPDPMFEGLDAQRFARREENRGAASPSPTRRTRVEPTANSAPESRASGAAPSPAARVAPLRPVSPPAAVSEAPKTLSLPEGAEAAIAAADWSELRRMVESCSVCPMSATRLHPVFGEGEPGPGLVIVGEAPGGEEDLQGIPFVGKSGQLLTAMLEAIRVERKRDCVILNVLKCRPPHNRNPEQGEVACCAHYLRRQLEILQPKTIFILGRFAAQTLLGLPDEGFSIGRLRGSIHIVETAGRKVPAVVSYHPSYLLRSPDAKAKAWEDLLLLEDAMRSAGVRWGAAADSVRVEA